jgi:hypothetical protein
LYSWKYRRLKLAIIQDIRRTGAISRYISRETETASVYSELQKIDLENSKIQTVEWSQLNQSLVFGWQLVSPADSIAHNFGIDPWASDIQMLSQFEWSMDSESVVILVHEHQTPVIELIDIAEQIQKKSGVSGLTLGILRSSDGDEADSRFESTWQQFAQKHQHIRFARFIQGSK